ncbi:hypothetical protein TWF506_010675 [Arthrobotrys conoides]|uniref:C2H2-type domain-containing protein n=1 Tax=Arthrobotrys conoides TaxID=74498 RepID=A0AAN8RQ38_9PEZI
MGQQFNTTAERPCQFKPGIHDTDTFQHPLSFVDFGAPADPAWPAGALDPGFQTDAPNFIGSFMTTIPGPDLSFASSSQNSHPTVPADNLVNPPNDTTLASSDKQKGKTSKSTSQRAKRKISTTYPCPKCNEKVSSLRVLGNHMRDVHQLKGFKCDNCETRVARYDNLESHKRTCRLDTANSSAATPTVRLKKKRGLRVSIRDILHPEPMQPLPKPNLQGGSEGTVLISPSLGEAPPQDASPPSHVQMSQLLNKGRNVGSSSNTITAGAPPDLAVKIKSLEDQLENAKLEASHWKLNYFQLQKKYGVVQIS